MKLFKLLFDFIYTLSAMVLEITIMFMFIFYLLRDIIPLLIKNNEIFVANVILISCIVYLFGYPLIKYQESKRAIMNRKEVTK